MSKIYCGECTHFFDGYDLCRHPTNIVQHEITTWRSFRVENRQRREPSDINKHNDCALYQIKVPVVKRSWWQTFKEAL